MQTSLTSKIFLAAERGCRETDWFRSYTTFNTGSWQHTHKNAPGYLHGCLDETLAGGRTRTMSIPAAVQTILLPLVGTLAYSDNAGYTSLLQPGQLQLVPADSRVLHLSNPYRNSLISYIQLEMSAGPVLPDAAPTIAITDLAAQPGQLAPVSFGNNITAPCIHLGKFAGRQDTFYTPQNNDAGIFFFVIQGAFEIAGRLLHARDSLYLWDNVATLELEALSNDAIVLVVEDRHEEIQENQNVDLYRYT